MLLEDNRKCLTLNLLQKEYPVCFSLKVTQKKRLEHFIFMKTTIDFWKHLKIILFIYFDCTGSLLLCRLSLVVRVEPLSVVMWLSSCGDFSCCGAQALGVSFSKVSTWVWQLWLTGTRARGLVVVAWRLAVCSMWNLLWIRDWTHVLALAGRFLYTAPPGKSNETTIDFDGEKLFFILIRTPAKNGSRGSFNFQQQNKTKQRTVISRLLKSCNTYECCTIVFL